MVNYDIGEKIFELMGGPEFLTASGATDLMKGEDMLSFRIDGRETRKRINLVKIVETGNDEYEVKFFKDNRARKMFKKISHHEKVNSHDLTTLFEEETGLKATLD